jgi:hypothetical protein
MQMDRMTVIPRYENPVLPPLVQPTNDQPAVKGKEEDVPGSPNSDKALDATKP